VDGPQVPENPDMRPTRCKSGNTDANERVR